jgi:hypothetical protein
MVSCAEKKGGSTAWQWGGLTIILVTRRAGAETPRAGSTRKPHPAQLAVSRAGRSNPAWRKGRSRPARAHPSACMTYICVEGHRRQPGACQIFERASVIGIPQTGVMFGHHQGLQQRDTQPTAGWRRRQSNGSLHRHLLSTAICSGTRRCRHWCARHSQPLLPPSRQMVGGQEKVRLARSDAHKSCPQWVFQWHQHLPHTSPTFMRIILYSGCSETAAVSTRPLAPQKACAC